MKYLIIAGLAALGIWWYDKQNKRSFVIDYFKSHNLSFLASLVPRMTDSEVDLLYDTINKFAANATALPASSETQLAALATKYGFTWS